MICLENMLIFDGLPGQYQDFIYYWNASLSVMYCELKFWLKLLNFMQDSVLRRRQIMLTSLHQRVQRTVFKHLNQQHKIV